MATKMFAPRAGGPRKTRTGIGRSGLANTAFGKQISGSKKAAHSKKNAGIRATKKAASRAKRKARVAAGGPKKGVAHLKGQRTSATMRLQNSTKSAAQRLAAKRPSSAVSKVAKGSVKRGGLIKVAAGAGGKIRPGSGTILQDKPSQRGTARTAQSRSSALSQRQAGYGGVVKKAAGRVRAQRGARNPAAQPLRKTAGPRAAQQRRAGGLRKRKSVSAFGK